jgi:prolipoprotein diacylglyceryltransferase
MLEMWASSAKWYDSQQHWEACLPSTFSVLFALAAVGSWIWIRQDEAIAREPRISAVDGSLAAMVGGLLVARAVFILLHLNYFKQNPIEAAWFWQGGLSAFGGAAGAWLGLIVYTFIGKKPLWRLADALAIPGSLLSSAGWSFCLFGGCAFGLRMPPGWFSVEAADMLGVVAPRWPTQTVGVVYSLLSLVFLYWLAGQGLRSGALAGIAQALIGLGVLCLGFTRADPTMLVAGFRLDVLGGALMLASGVTITVIRLR